MRHLLALSFATLAFIACGNKGDTAAQAERTRSFCADLASELRSAASAYGSYAAKLASDPAFAQNERAIVDLPYGMSPRERSIASLQLHKRLQYCVYQRKAEEKALDALSNRANSEVGKLSSLDAPADIATALDALANTAAEIGRLPVRD